MAADTPSSQVDHCRRVAAVALEMGERLRLPAGDLELLKSSALLHHSRAELLQPGSLDRLAADLGLETPAASGAAATARSPVSDIVDVADFFCDRVEFLPFEYLTVTQILDELGWMAVDRVFDPAIVAALAGLRRAAPEDFVEHARRLPVYPAVALRLMRLAADDRLSLRALEPLIASDQVLAARVVAAANSSLYSPAKPIKSIAQAVSYIGLDAMTRVSLAAAFRPLFASADLRALWRHSLAMAERTEALAPEGINRGEAFLAGLVHDIGRLAMRLLPHEDSLAYARLVERGCDPVLAEMLLCGADHGAIGAQILGAWAFPGPLVEAVRQHHSPERSEGVLASVLYAAEFLCGSEEDHASRARIEGAWGRIGAPAEAVEPRPSPLLALVG